MQDTDVLLHVEDYRVTLRSPTRDKAVRPVRGVNLDIRSGEIVGLVGESGSGKSSLALSMLRLYPPEVRATASGSALFRGRDLVTLKERDLRSVRGTGIGMIFQEPRSSLDPVIPIGTQVVESVRANGVRRRGDAKRRATELLDWVGMRDPVREFSRYPHELSGGMCQRVMVAVALAREPDLLIADEPTTSLDVTIQAHVIDLLGRLRRELHLAILMITHDLNLVSGFADRIAVMYAGRIVETGTAGDLLEHPKHPYTVALWNCAPELSRVRTEPLMPIAGSAPDLSEPIVGCSFKSRCVRRLKMCDEPPMPELLDETTGHSMECWNPVA